MLKVIIISMSINFLLLAEAILPIPLEVKYDKKRASLGKKLFFDSGLSKDGSISCASCHHLPGSGADVTPFSFGVNGTEGGIHSPTVLNSAFNFVQFWDGRAKNLQDQAKQPISNPLEMASSLPAALAYVKTNPAYLQAFNASYEEGLTEESLVDAIAEFEKALYTPNAPFDKYLRGDKTALNKEEKEGYTLFNEYGCISCHNGINIGGNMYQLFGALRLYQSKKDNLGRFNVTKKESDKYFFKVPSLRNIALTPPYLHDGSAVTLKEAITKMMEYQVGMIANAEDIDKIEAFLKTLTGDSPSILDESQ
ncbi:MAG: cytochrome B6 [Arcobacter sp.]|nr:MAG: cytochrome B6 [Arcobacter sp.]